MLCAGSQAGPGRGDYASVVGCDNGAWKDGSVTLGGLAMRI